MDHFIKELEHLIKMMYKYNKDLIMEIMFTVFLMIKMK
jgi:hypothetical protein